MYSDQIILFQAEEWFRIGFELTLAQHADNRNPGHFANFRLGDTLFYHWIVRVQLNPLQIALLLG